MSDCGAGGAKLFVIVARDELELYEHVRRQFAGDAHVQVILDRRRDGPGHPDERRGERRRPRPGQEVPADLPVAIRPRCTAPPPPPPEVRPARPGESLDGPPGDAAAFQTVLRVIDTALAVARPLSALLHQRQFQRQDPSVPDPTPGSINAAGAARPGSRSRSWPAPRP